MAVPLLPLFAVVPPPASCAFRQCNAVQVFHLLEGKADSCLTLHAKEMIASCRQKTVQYSSERGHFAGCSQSSSFADPYPGSGAFGPRDPGWVKNPDPGSEPGMNNLDHITRA
jgi:hypothetical protein